MRSHGYTTWFSYNHAGYGVFVRICMFDSPDITIFAALGLSSTARSNLTDTVELTAAYAKWHQNSLLRWFCGHHR